MNTTLYSVSHLGKTLLWVFFNTFFLFFAVYGLEADPLLAGGVALGFAVIDVAADIPATLLIAKYLPKFRGMSRWVTVATPLCAFFLVSCFAFANFAKGPSAMALSILAGVVFRILFTFVDVPLNTSIGRFNRSSKARSLIAGGRSGAGILARIILALLTALIVERATGIQAERIWLLALLLALISPFLIIPTFAVVDRKSWRSETLQIPDGAAHNISLAKNGVTANLIVLTIANCIFLLLTPQLINALIFLVDRDPRIEISFSQLWLLGACASGISVWGWTWLANRFEKSRAAVLSLLASAAAFALFPILKNDAVGLLAVVAVAGCVYHANTLIWSMLPDAVDEASRAMGFNLHTPLIGVFASIGKLMIGLSQFLGALALAAAGFPDRPDFVLYERLVVAMAVTGCLLTALVLWRFDLTHSRHLVLSDNP